MLKMPPKTIHIPLGLMVRHTVLPTDLLDTRREVWQMTVIHKGKEVVLDLMVQMSRKYTAEGRRYAKVLCRHHLMFPKIRFGECIARGRTLFRQVVDLAVDHER